MNWYMFSGNLHFLGNYLLCILFLLELVSLLVLFIFSIVFVIQYYVEKLAQATSIIDELKRLP